MSKFEEYLSEENLSEANVTFVKGSELSKDQQEEAKRRFVHRYTGNNKPQWASQTWKDDKPYPLHFKDDKDWLENTEFAVTKSGKLCNKTKYCNSKPTYPNNPELRKELKEDLNESVNAESIGKELADLLYLKVDKDGRIKTSWGSKTYVGLYESVKRIINAYK